MSQTTTAKSRRGLHRRIYDWVLHWADTRYGLPALVVLAFAESSFFPIPPDVLLLPLCLGRPRKALRFAFWCSAASVLGGMLGYFLGLAAWQAGLREVCFAYVPGFTQETFANVQGLYQEWNFWIVFTAGFSPLPYKVFTITAGVFGVNFPMFVLASLVSRSARFYLEAFLLQRFGPAVRVFVEKRLAVLSLLFCVLLVGSFFLLKHLF